MFFEQRRWRHIGDNPDDDDLAALWALHRAICARWDLEAEVIPHRAKKDPRDLKILDPASGSCHFLLYAFDLLLVIYDESWDDPELGPALRRDYADRAAFDRAVPALILARNLHGIDIDPRACQIGALALWLRAQRRYAELGLAADDRPPINRGNIVCAEPMPGERDLLDEYLQTIDIRLRPLVHTVWEKMQVAGEAGSLLKIEEEIAAALDAARADALVPLTPVQMTIVEQDAQPRQMTINVGRDQQRFWKQAEARLLDALREYAEQAASSQATVRRLFAHDAAQGFAFIDVCRQRYDVVLMNPPFGAGTPEAEALRGSELYRNAVSKNLAWGFVERAKDLLSSTSVGLVGAIVDRTIFQKSSYELFRTTLIQSCSLTNYLDLGHGVLDDADVRASAFTISNATLPSPTLFVDVRQVEIVAKDDVAYQALQSVRQSSMDTLVINRRVSELLGIPFASFSYWLSRDAIHSVFNQHTIGQLKYRVGGGLQCNDVFRFVRISSEVPLHRDKEQEHRWLPFYNGGPFTGYWLQNHQFVDWLDGGRNIKAKITYEIGDHPSRYVANEQMYLKQGIAGGKRGEYFDVHVMPSDMIFSNEGRSFQADSVDDLGMLLAYLNHPICQNLVNVFCGQHKGSEYLRKIPIPLGVTEKSSELADLAYCQIDIKRYWSTTDEGSAEFIMPAGNFMCLSDANLASIREQLAKTLDEDRLRYAQNENDIDEIIRSAFGDALAEELSELGWTEAPRPNDDIGLAVPHVDAISVGNGLASNIVSYIVGVAFGRWDVRLAIYPLLVPALQGPFEPLPVCSPGMLIGPDGLPAQPEGIASEEWLRTRPNASTLPAKVIVPEAVIPDDMYPLRVDWDGIMVDDEGHPDDIVSRVRDVLTVIWGDRANEIEHETCEMLGVRSLRDYVRRSSGFFAHHLKSYSRSRCQGPIYWPVSTASGSYTLWIYYQRLNSDTLYLAINRYLEPKMDAVVRALADLAEQIPSASGKESSRLRDEHERSHIFLGELRELRDELLRVAALRWEPNLDDGVIITASPLWRCFRHSKWSKDCRATWDKLERGEYDWAYLAHAIWPDRVREKCRTDRSLAIAHDLEHLCIGPPLQTQRRGRRSAVVTADLPIDDLDQESEDAG